MTIQTTKLSLCRNSNFSKYFGDLIDCCFGRETLVNSVLNCSNTRSNKTNMLDTDIAKDLVSHTVDKFKPVMSVSVVRAAIRQKTHVTSQIK